MATDTEYQGAAVPPAEAGGLADVLRRYREAAGLTQEELAERAGLSREAISLLERAERRRPHVYTLRKLATALALSAPERAAFMATARGHGVPRARADPPQGVVPTLAKYPQHPATTYPTNLPHALTSFVGRQREVATLRRLLGQTRLLTLTGAGGCGKTRLALEAAHALANDPAAADMPADGIWLVELAALSDGQHVPQAVANILGVRTRPDQALLDSLRAFLQPRQVLVLLDNCEHLVLACARLVEDLLRACPRLTVLATSREALRIDGERSWRVPSLGLPTPRGVLTVEQSLASEAVQLFIQRAQVVCPEFTLGERQMGPVVQICRRLDGIPLAIELAAARLAALSLDQVAARLDDRLRLLNGGSRTALPRQQTLRATLDWSYDLLSERERLLLGRVAVFAGGWTLEAAEAICAGDGMAPEEVLDLLAGLVAKSLVLLEEGSTGARYGLLETVRQYGWEKLRATGGGAGAVVQERHLDWYLALAEQAARRIGGPEREAWLERLETEVENLRAALAWSGQGSGQETGLRLACALEDFWYMRGYAGEGRRWLQELLERAEAAPAALRARALDVLALLAFYQGDFPRALRLFEAAYAMHAGAGQVPRATWSLTHQAMVAIFVGEYQRATTLLEQVLPAHRAQGDRHGVGWALCYLAQIQHLQGDYPQAAALYAESLAVFRELADTFGVGCQLHFLATVARDLGDDGQARRLHRESLHVGRALRDKGSVADSLEGLAVVAVADGHALRAARLLGAAHGLREASGQPVDAVDRTAYVHTVASVQTALGAEACAVEWAAGQAMVLEEAIAYALAEDQRA